MSLTTGAGPLSSRPAGRFSPPIPAGAVYVEPHPRRIEARVGGRTVIDTEQALLVHRPDQTLVYAFPPEVISGVAHVPQPDAPGYVTVAWDAVDEWYEEGRRLVHYPPNPYHRVDCRPTGRRLRVEVDGTVLVDTDDTVILFETSLAPRLYVHPDKVRIDLLERSSSWSYCNYKGEATYWSAVVDGRRADDVAFSYEDPFPESSQIRGYLSFDPARAHVEAELPRGATLARLT